MAAFGPAIRTEGNQNNEIGVPNTLFRLERDTKYAVVEMGMSALGEIERLARSTAQRRDHYLHRRVAPGDPGQPGEHFKGEAGIVRACRTARPWH